MTLGFGMILCGDLTSKSITGPPKISGEFPTGVKVLRGRLPVLIVDVVPEAWSVDHRQLHPDALLLNICTNHSSPSQRAHPTPSGCPRMGCDDG